MQKQGFTYGGISPTGNPLNYNSKKPVSYRHFVIGDFIGDFIVIDTKTDCRFDNMLRLKEDYDFTLQAITECGGIVRLNYYGSDFVHRTNAGGAVGYRTSVLEKESIIYLMQKWGGAIKLHPSRENEIIIKL